MSSRPGTGACAPPTMLFNTTLEPSLVPLCLSAFAKPRHGEDNCPSDLTWGCVSSLSMSILAGLTLLATIALGCSTVVRQGSVWIQGIYFVTFVESFLLFLRYLAVADDLLVIVSESLEAGVMVVTSYFLASICEQLYRGYGDGVLTEDDDSGKMGMRERTETRNRRVLYFLVLPVDIFLGVGILVTATLSLTGMGSNLDCHRFSWLLISTFRTLAVTLCVISAVLIHRKLRYAEVSETYRQNRTRLVWFIVGTFLFATIVELGNDIWGLVNRSNSSCYAWAGKSVSHTDSSDNGDFVALRICVRVFKFFVPMWSIVLLFRALLPSRHDGRVQRKMSWATHSDAASVLSSHGGSPDGRDIGWIQRPSYNVRHIESSVGSHGGILSGDDAPSLFGSLGRNYDDEFSESNHVRPLLSTSPHSPKFSKQNSIQ